MCCVWASTASAQPAATCDRECLRGKVTELLYALQKHDVSRHLHLVEKYSRVSDETLEYYITVDDPTVWSRPWTLMIPLKRTSEALLEFACHEGNYGLPAILKGARAQER